MKTTPRSFALLMLLALSIAATLSAQDALTNGLVGYYPLSGNANDASGNGNNATVYGAVLATNRFGIANDSYSFGSGKYIMTTNSLGFPTSTNDFSVSEWVCLSKRSTIHQTLFCNLSDAQFILTISPMGSVYPFTAFLAFLTGGTGHPNDCETPEVAWETNRWYNVQVVRRANAISIYRDGAMLAQRVTVHGNNATITNRRLKFSSATYPPYPLNGQLDDIRIYSRSLSTSELAQVREYEATPRIAASKALRLDFSKLLIGTRYQLQTSTDLATWTDLGSPFTATSLTAIQYVDVGWGGAYFRLRGL